MFLVCVLEYQNAKKKAPKSHLGDKPHKYTKYLESHSH